MALHVEKRLDLAHRQVLAVSERHQLVECAEKLVGVSQNLPLVESLAGAGDHLRKQVQRVDVLQDVGLAVGDKNHVKLVKGLVNEADIVLLDGRVLGAAVGQFRERGQQRLYPRSWHLAELSREDSFPAASAD